MFKVTRSTAKRQAWMLAYENALKAECPELTGRVDWDTATFFFNSGLLPSEAASRTAARHKEGA